ncbi:MAG: HAMP domain-containing histidine kinase [Tannerellaceae bacterium]|nr:HAMP domain-containing histidine kinase [Tannerellaceae bacterium]
MVEQILTLAVENRATFKLAPGHIKVEELLPALQEQHRLKSSKEVVFMVDLPKGLTLYADRRHFYNMISNLIENSIKYTATEPVRITIKGWEDEHEVCIAVADNGIGIDRKYQQQVFEKFFRVPQGNLHIANGYGLGLYYIKDMMTRHHGRISLKSQPGKGSVFTLHFNK